MAAIFAGCFVVRTPSPDAAESLRRALERNLDWIKTHIPALAAGSLGNTPDVQAYVDWLYDRLKDRIPPDSDPDNLDRLVRSEVRKVFYGRRSRQPPILAVIAHNVMTALKRLALPAELLTARLKRLRF